MYQLKLSEKAASDISDAFGWYEAQQAGLGHIFLNEIERTFKRIEYQPNSFSFIGTHYKKAILRQFPYIVVFEINDREIIVYSIFHTSRKPVKKYRK